MFPSKAVPLRCNWSLDEALIRHQGPQCLCLRGAWLVIIGGYRNMSLHEPDQQDLPAVARTHQAGVGPAVSVGIRSSVLKVATRVGSLAQPGIRLFLRT